MPLLGAQEDPRLHGKQKRPADRQVMRLRSTPAAADRWVDGQREADRQEGRPAVLRSPMSPSSYRYCCSTEQHNDSPLLLHMGRPM